MRVTVWEHSPDRTGGGENRSTWKKTLSEQGREPTTNSTRVRNRPQATVREVHFPSISMGTAFRLKRQFTLD